MSPVTSQAATPSSGYGLGNPAAGSAVQAQPGAQVDEEAARRGVDGRTRQPEPVDAAARRIAAGRPGPRAGGAAHFQLQRADHHAGPVRASYAKVAANLDALLGPDNTDAEAAGGAATTAGSAGTTPQQPTRRRAQPPPRHLVRQRRRQVRRARAGRRLAGSQPGATAGAGTAATPGAVGTSGSTTPQIDPTIRAKLIELRQNLKAFEKASGGPEK